MSARLMNSEKVVLLPIGGTGPLRQDNQNRGDLLQGGLVCKHHEVVLHDAEFAQCSPQKALMRLGIARAGLERAASMSDDLGVRNDVAIRMVQIAVGKPDHVAGKTVGDDLPPTVFGTRVNHRAPDRIS